MLKLATLIAATALAGCAVPTPLHSVTMGPSPSPTPTPPYQRDRCGEEITPTHPATPENVVCP